MGATHLWHASLLPSRLALVQSDHPNRKDMDKLLPDAKKDAAKKPVHYHDGIPTLHGIHIGTYSHGHLDASRTDHS